jgi:hypothetical protein
MTGRRYAIAWVILIVTVLGIIALGWFGARRGYDRHEERRATEAAASLIGRGTVGTEVPVAAPVRRAGPPLGGAVVIVGIQCRGHDRWPVSPTREARPARPGGPAGGARAST